MTHFLYTTFVCDYDELEPRLNELGAEGWRLHTCEPVTTQGPSGTGVLRAFVVMDQMAESEDEGTPRSLQSEGIAMKG